MSCMENSDHDMITFPLLHYTQIQNSAYCAIPMTLLACLCIIEIQETYLHTDLNKLSSTSENVYRACVFYKL